MPNAAYFRTQAARCRRLARTASDALMGRTLKGMAEDYERLAREAERGEAGGGDKR